jgi:hypothetical protein
MVTSLDWDGLIMLLAITNITETGHQYEETKALWVTMYYIVWCLSVSFT